MKRHLTFPSLQAPMQIFPAHQQGHPTPFPPVYCQTLFHKFKALSHLIWNPPDTPNPDRQPPGTSACVRHALLLLSKTTGVSPKG